MQTLVIWESTGIVIRLLSRFFVLIVDSITPVNSYTSYNCITKGRKSTRNILGLNIGSIDLVSVVLDTNMWFHSTFVHPGEISIAIGAEYD